MNSEKPTQRQRAAFSRFVLFWVFSSFFPFYYFCFVFLTDKLFRMVLYLFVIIVFYWCLRRNPRLPTYLLTYACVSFVFQLSCWLIYRCPDRNAFPVSTNKQNILYNILIDNSTILHYYAGDAISQK